MSSVSSYNSDNSSVPQSQKTFDLVWANHGINNLHWKPDDHCNYQSLFGYYCSRPWCPKHGQSNRIEHAKKFLRQVVPGTKYLYATFNFNAYVLPDDVSKARTYLLDKLKQKFPLPHYCWTLEFKNFVPHLNLILASEKAYILCSVHTPLRFSVKDIWSKALERIGIPEPTRRKVQELEEVKDIGKCVNYIYKTKQVLPAKEMPYHHKKWRFCNEWCSPSY